MKARAAPIVSDKFWVFDQSRTVKFSTSVTSEQQEINGAGAIYFLEVPGIADPNQWGNYTSVVNAPNSPVMSDAFGVLFRDPDYLLFFLSDTSNEPCPYPMGPNLVFEYLLPNGRYGGIFDASRYLLPALQAQGWTAAFGSGLTVPEPSTIFLLGSGVGVLVLLRKRSTVN
jgi:hypothetical protein